MFLREISVSSFERYVRRKEFNLQTGCVVGLYLEGLPKLRTDGIAKLIIKACPIEVPLPRNEKLLDVLTIPRPFDFEAFWKGDREFRRKGLLEFLHKACDFAAGEYGWDCHAFEDAYNYVISRNYRNDSYWKKPVRSPNRRFNAQVYYEFQEDGIDLFIFITNERRQLLSRNLMVTLRPHEFFLRHALGTLKWIDDTRIVLESKLGDHKWELTIKE